MKQITISPKEKGTTIKFGKLPIFTRSLRHGADMDEVVQLKVEGRYYAIERRLLPPSPIEEVLEELKTAQGFTSVSVELPQDDEVAKECKADVEEVNEPTEKKKPTSSLESLGFTNLSSSSPREVKRAKAKAPKVDYNGRPLEQGDLSLFEWLKNTDFIVYKLFLSSTGRPTMEKVIDYDDVVLLLMGEGLVDRKGKSNKSMRAKGRSAQNVANMALARLLHQGIIQKEEGTSKYCLTLTKGGAYARKVYATVQARAYDWNTRKGRILQTS